MVEEMVEEIICDGCGQIRRWEGVTCLDTCPCLVELDGVEMPNETKPLSASEIEAIGAHLLNADIALPKADMVSTQELGRVLESAVAFEQRLFNTIRDLQKDIIHRKWLRDDVEHQRLDQVARAEKAEDKLGVCEDALANAQMNRDMVTAENNRLLKSCTNLQAENKRLTEKLEAIASVPFEPFSAAIGKAAIAETEGE